MRLDLSFGMIFIDYFMETGLSGDKRGNRPDRRLIQLVVQVRAKTYGLHSGQRR